MSGVAQFHNLHLGAVLAIRYLGSFMTFSVFYLFTNAFLASWSSEFS
jgi:hypothetical protein